MKRKFVMLKLEIDCDDKIVAVKMTRENVGYVLDIGASIKNIGDDDYCDWAARPAVKNDTELFPIEEETI